MMIAGQAGVIVYARPPGHPLLSVAVTVKVAWLFDVGVPERTPLEPSSVRPAGNEPADTVYVYGATPPLAVSVWLNADATVMLLSDGSVIVTPQPTVRFSDCGLLTNGVALLSVAVTENVATPGIVGVPEITPVEAFNVKPLGSDPEVIDHVYGLIPPTALRVCE